MYAGGAILALDAATRTGVAQGAPGETPVLDTVSFKRELDDDFDIWARAQVWLIRRLNAAVEADRPIELLVLEGLVPQYDKTIQCGIYACFGAVARNKRIPIMWAMPQTWRAVILGDGKLKTAVAKTRAVSVAAQLGWNPQGHDEAEAACLWLWACTKVAPRQVQRFPLFMRGAA
jgi:hypothetical protein